MKQTILAVAAVMVAAATMIVWLARPSLFDPDADKAVSAIEHNVDPPIRQRQESASEQPVNVANNLEAPAPAPQTRGQGNADANAVSFSAKEHTDAIHNSPSLSQIENEGYMEILARDRSSYAGYNIDTLVALAESGDKRALLHASLRPSSLTVNQRKRYAIEAAKQGYTSALVGLGGQLLMPTKEASEKLEPDPVLGFALMLVAYEAGDAALRSRNTWAYMRSHVSARQQKKARALAYQLSKQIGARP